MRNELNGYERIGIMFDTFLLIFVAMDVEEELLFVNKESRLKELGHICKVVDKSPLWWHHSLTTFQILQALPALVRWVIGEVDYFTCIVSAAPKALRGGEGLGLCTILNTVAYVSMTWSLEQHCVVVWINKKLLIPVCGEEKNQNQRTIGSGYFKNLKELVGFAFDA